MGLLSVLIYPAATNTTASGVGVNYTYPLVAIAAAIAIAGGLIGTGMAQQGIGASGMGIFAEKPEKFGQVLIFFVIPETLRIMADFFSMVMFL